MSFVFFEGEDSALTANDGATITGLDLGTVFCGETKEVSFRIGNKGTSATNFQITVAGVNTSIVSDVEVYDPGYLSWRSESTISGIIPNGVTDRIKVRITPTEGSVIAAGTFLINVSEV